MNREEFKKPANAFVQDNKFFILGEFTDELNQQIILPLTNKIDELSKLREATIEFHINSHGGNGEVLMHLVRLCEVARERGIVIRTVVPQVAYSAGSMLAIVGDKGERYIGSSGEHCVHYGTHYGYAAQTPLQVERESEHKKRWFRQVLEHYGTYSNIPKVEEHIRDDNFFIPANKCIKWGLADKYMEEM